MSNVWDADVEVTPELATRLIEGQFPQLSPVRLEACGVGWDNVAFVVNGAWIFRLPRRRMGATLIVNELRALPTLAPHLPLPIPVPTFAGTAEGDYPYPFLGYARLSGATACGAAWNEEERARNAPALARFLSALHRLPVSDEVRSWAPQDEIGRTDLRKRGARIRERLSALEPPEGVDSAAILALAAHLERTPMRTEPTCWVHGDLYGRHLLVDEARSLCGVIDWGDVHLGDPALDLSIAFSFLPPEAREEFRAVYGSIDAATWERARFRALDYGAILTVYGRAVGDKAIYGVGEYALRAACR